MKASAVYHTGLDSPKAPRKGSLEAMYPRLIEFLDRQAKIWLWLEVVGLITLIGYLDWYTGYELSILPFYSVPIFLMVWFNEKQSAVLVALICALVWWWADTAAGHPYLENWHQAWDIVMRIIYFLTVAYAGTNLRHHLQLLDQARRLEQEIIRISEREQQRIGQDLHDGICQYYAAIGCAAGSLKQTLKARSAPEAAAASELEQLIRDGVDQTRSLSRGLFPVKEDDRGLQSAFEELAATLRRLSKLDCIVHCESGVIVSNNVAATHLFRIAQESLNNAITHGKATEALVSLESDPGGVKLTVSDNGTGFPAQLPDRRGMGLNIMKYRAQTMGGRLEISPNPGGGASVSCIIPLDRAQRQP